MSPIAGGQQRGSRLADKVALVTGAGRNIGKAIALAFAREGAAVVVNVRQNRAEADQVVGEVEKLGSRGLAIVADVGEREQVTEMADQALKEFDRIDIVVNNAAIRPGKPFLEISLEDWRRVMAVNSEAAFHLCQAAVPGMIQRGRGSILFIGSPTAWGLGQDRVHVSASKAALVGMTKALASDLAGHGIRSNMICPGFIQVDRPLPGNLLETVPMGRFGSPDDVAETAVFLASDDSALVTGQVVFVNGGHYWQ